MFKFREDNKKQAIKNLISSSYIQIERCDIAGVYRTIANALEMSKTIARRHHNDQDPTVELNFVLTKLKEMLLLKSQVMGSLEMAKINFKNNQTVSN
jgi:hypothetical protein